MVAPKYRAYVFTINNYSAEDVQMCKDIVCDYIIFGKEIAPTTGTPHLQGYIVMPSQRTYGGMIKNTFKKRASYIAHEYENSSAAHNETYCSKDATDVYTSGLIPPGKGARTDIWQIKKMIDEGAIMLDLMNANFELTVRCERGFKSYMNMLLPARTTRPVVYWVCGPTGAGKTEYAKRLGESYYIKNNSKYWDNYTQQDVIILDDFEKEFMNFRELLRLLDKNVFIAEVKYGTVNINSPYIVISCDRPPECFWSGTDLTQIERRLCKVICIPKTREDVRVTAPREEFSWDE